MKLEKLQKKWALKEQQLSRCLFAKLLLREDALADSLPRSTEHRRRRVKTPPRNPTQPELDKVLRQQTNRSALYWILFIHQSLNINTATKAAQTEDTDVCHPLV